jgi:hypothetical protein
VDSRVVTTRDRRGNLVSEVRWTAAGALESAWVKIPDGSWLGIEPRATTVAPWGLSDRLWHWCRGEGEPGADWSGDREPASDRGWPKQGARGFVPVTIFEALDWARIDHIPAAAEPARVPPGGGAAVLNLIAELALRQGARRLAYRSPYPTEALFLILLESFRYEPAPPDPLAAFMAGGLEWVPAPHERVFAADGLSVQLRGRVEKVVFHGAAYYRLDWQGIVRHAPRRVRETREGVVCSLWALGRPLEDHLLLSADGTLLRVLEPGPVACVARAMPPAVAVGVGATVAVGSAPALAPFIRSAAGACALEWGAVARDLVALGPDRIRVSERLRRGLAEALAATPGRGARAAIALAAVAEIAALVGDMLRARAQAALAELPPEAQAAALEAVGEAGDVRSAQEIAGAVEALLVDLAA